MSTTKEGLLQSGNDKNSSKPSPVYMMSESDPSTDPESDQDDDSEAESQTEPHKDSAESAITLPAETDSRADDVYKEGFLASAHTQPKTDGDLCIHSVLQCGCDVMMCQFNNEGTLLAVGLTNGTIKVWTRPAHIAVENQRVLMLYPYRANLTAQLYSPDTGSLVKMLRNSGSVSFNLPVTALRFISSPESHSLLLATYASGHVRCWYVWGGDCMWSEREAGDARGGEGGMQRQTLSLSISPYGEKAATAGSDSVIHLYDLTSHQRVMTCRASSTRTVMDGHRFRVFAVTFHPEREREFISGGWDNTIQFWDSRQQRAVRMLSGPHICGDALQIDPAANHILSGSWRRDNVLEVWDYCSGEKVYEVPRDPQGESQIYTCHWLGENHIVAAGSQANMLKIINRNSMRTESRLQGLTSAVFSSSICPAGKCSGWIAATSGSSVYLLERGSLRYMK